MAEPVRRSEPTIAAIVLAAGSATRFGGPKQLAELDGRPLLEHGLAAVADSMLTKRFVVLGAAAHEVLARVDVHGAEPVIAEGWHAGMGRSLAAGASAAIEAGASAVVVTLGDQPLISPAAIDRVAQALVSTGRAAVQASYGGRPGHPVGIGADLLLRVPALAGDMGARDLLAEAGPLLVPCDGLGSPSDVDTPGDLADVSRISGAREG